LSQAVLAQFGRKGANLRLPQRPAASGVEHMAANDRRAGIRGVA
jgi:hypothetical protein